MRAVQIITCLCMVVSSSHQKFDNPSQPKCCSGSLSPSYQRLQPWTDSLKAAVYQSIIRHLDFPGSLDGRLDRDEKLWSYLQEANFLTDKKAPFEDLFEETATGVLIKRLRNDQRSSYEFQQTDNSVFDCPDSNCHYFNSSLLALWRIRKSDSPNSMWIRIRLPKIKNNPIEDMYYYSAKYGLKKLSPEPTELNQFNRHRFSNQPNKEIEYKYLDRMGFQFPFTRSIYGSGRVTPSSFIYDSPPFTESDEDDWYRTSSKPVSEHIYGTSGRYQHYHPSSYYNPSRPHVSSRPNQYDHYSQTHPSVSPSQDLDQPSQDVRGFMPSVRPISAPPPYRSEYNYDTRFLRYYSNPQSPPFQHTTVPSNYFKPSVEYTRYSEIDPFFHPDTEGVTVQTSPIPQDMRQPMQLFPSSINNQLPKNPSRDNLKPFQIVVENMNPQSHSSGKVSLEITSPKTKFQPVNQPTTSNRPELDEEVPVIAFGEKIKPKTTSTTESNSLTTQPTLKIKPGITIDYMTQVSERGNESHSMTTDKPYDKLLDTHNMKLTGLKEELNNFKTEPVSNSSQMENTKLTTDSMVEDKTEQMGFTNFETTEHMMVSTKNMTNFDSKTTAPTDATSTLAENTTEELSTTESSELSSNKEMSTHMKTDSTNGYSTEQTTMFDTETTTESISQTIDDDFFSSLANLFSADSTTMEVMSTNEATTEQSPATDPETQESRHHSNVNYRLLTFPGDPVSIVANRISKTVSYQTAKGRERKLYGKNLFNDQHKFSSMFKEYGKVF